MTKSEISTILDNLINVHFINENFDRDKVCVNDELIEYFELKKFIIQNLTFIPKIIFDKLIERYN